jgi:hypothetical protein
MSPGATLQQYAYTGGANQEFQLEPLEDGFFRIVARHSGLVVEAVDPSPTGRTRLRQAIWTGADTQQWVPFVRTQAGWRSCQACQGLFFDGAEATACPAGGQHVSSGDARFALGVDMPSLNGWRDNWRCCRRCAGIFLAVGQSSVCAAGGAHDDLGSPNYSLSLSTQGWLGAREWRRCQRCQVLYRAGTASRCPAGSEHQGVGNGGYALMLG